MHGSARRIRASSCKDEASVFVLCTYEQLEVAAHGCESRPRSSTQRQGSSFAHLSSLRAIQLPYTAQGTKHSQSVSVTRRGFSPPQVQRPMYEPEAQGPTNSIQSTAQQQCNMLRRTRPTVHTNRVCVCVSLTCVTS